MYRLKLVVGIASCLMAGVPAQACSSPESAQVVSGPLAITESTGDAVARPGATEVGLRVGDTAPDIVGEDIGGTLMKLSDYRGKVVLLTFWGFW